MIRDLTVNYIDSFLDDYFDIAIPDITVTDIVEILIISFFAYQLLKWIKNSRAWTLLRGILIILAFFIIAALFEMNTILWLGERLISVAFIAIIVVFQPELRNALEHLGRRNILNLLIPSAFRRNRGRAFSNKTLNDIVSACLDMSKVKTGALIVIEKEVPLGDYIRTGISIDSLLSRQLIVNIFEKNTPLHDGAIIVRGDRIVAATCYLPLSQNVSISKSLGTRHRAALGVSEVSDSVTIVVSEETGDISAAEGGIITGHLTEEGLKSILKRLQLEEEANEREGEKTDAVH